MEPGPELDALVAEHVFGMKRTEYMGRFHWATKEMGWASFVTEVRDYDSHRTQGDPQPKPLPPYSTSIEPAWKVVEELSKSGFYVSMDVHLDGTANCSVLKCSDKETYKPVGIEVCGQTAPHAICLAALKAVGYPLDK